MSDCKTKEHKSDNLFPITLNVGGGSQVFITLHLNNFAYNVATIKEHIYLSMGVTVDDQTIEDGLGNKYPNDHRLGPDLFENKKLILRINASKTRTPPETYRGREGSYQIFFKNFSGMTKSLTVTPNDTIKNVKDQIFAIEGIPPSYQVLTNGSQILDDHKCIEDYSIREHSFFVSIRSSPLRRIQFSQFYHQDDWRGVRSFEFFHNKIYHPFFLTDDDIE